MGFFKSKEKSKKNNNSKKDVVDVSRNPLYFAIEQSAWQSVLAFLNTGKWPDFKKTKDENLALLAKTKKKYLAHKPKRLANTWVEKDSFCQLPLHCAVCNLAPLPIIEKLVILNPNACSSPDSDGNIPLHLSFASNTPDISAFLLREYPEGITKINNAELSPVDLSRTPAGDDSVSGTLTECMKYSDIYTQKDAAILLSQMASQKREMRKAQDELLTLREELTCLKEKMTFEAKTAENLKKEQQEQSLQEAGACTMIGNEIDCNGANIDAKQEHELQQAGACSFIPNRMNCMCF